MEWYEDDVKKAEQERNNCSYKPQTVFYGSSTIKLWDTLYQDFSTYKPLNLGFGGSTLAACAWFSDRLLLPLQQLKSIVIYAGDNDLGDGRHPEEVFLFYQQLIFKIQQHFKSTTCYYISIKPSISRANIIDKIKYTNQLIERDIQQKNNQVHFIRIYDLMVNKKGAPLKEYFEADGLHLNKKGYKLWKETLLQYCRF